MKRSGTVVVAMIAMLVGGVPGVSAQSLGEGARVRVTRQLDEGTGSTVSMKAGEEYKIVPEQITGTVVRLDDEEIVITWDGRPVRVPLDRVARLEVSRGGKSRARRAGVGFSVGAVSGAVLGFAGAQSDDFFGPGAAALTVGTMLGVLGAVLGAISAPGERWEPVETGKRVSYTLTVPKRGVGAQVSVEW